MQIKKITREVIPNTEEQVWLQIYTSVIQGTINGNGPTGILITQNVINTTDKCFDAYKERWYK